MGEHRLSRRMAFLLVPALVVAALVVVSPLGAAKQTTYTVTPLVSDQPGVAPVTDPDLVNPWGLISGPTTPWWVSDNGTNKSTLYRGDGVKQGLVVTVAGGPTGTTFNSTASGFQLPTGGKALFLFDSEDGKVRAWNGAQGTTAIVVADRSNVHAIYKGLSLAATPAGPRLYAADFHNQRIDVFDGAFGLVPNSGFDDPALPKRGFSPFNVQVIGSRVFVAYAKLDSAGEDELAGQGRGFVDVYDLAGNLLGGIDGHGQLNAPWGLEMASAGFGTFAGDLLVGNFGDGRINAYREVSPGQFVHDGKLRGDDNRPLEIDGLWALRVAQGGNNGTAGTLYFTAGPGEEMHGLFGKITPG